MLARGRFHATPIALPCRGRPGFEAELQVHCDCAPPKSTNFSKTFSSSSYRELNVCYTAHNVPGEWFNFPCDKTTSIQRRCFECHHARCRGREEIQSELIGGIVSQTRRSMDVLCYNLFVDAERVEKELFLTPDKCRNILMLFKIRPSLPACVLLYRYACVLSQGCQGSGFLRQEHHSFHTRGLRSRAPEDCIFLLDHLRV